MDCVNLSSIQEVIFEMGVKLGIGVQCADWALREIQVEEISLKKA